MRRRISVVLRVLLALLYAAPVTLPALASLLHAADHMVDTQRAAMSRLEAGVHGSTTRPHVHPHVGDHEHDADGGHPPAVTVLLTAADGMDHDTEAPVQPPRLMVHVPVVMIDAPPVLERCADEPAGAMRPRADPGAAPPSPPPRTDCAHRLQRPA